ncbi:MAG: D-tyrosyl-tRNA(Tyr) deacylase [Nitrospiraceae bacterium]|nr:MAG: D-tyrosyl-tRNA(Tyr) deacylase [Nitrospiraceae bacterium]
MRVLIQRVTKAGVVVGGREIASIGRGLLLLVGIGINDGEKEMNYLAQKIANLRIFEDGEGKMNLSIRQVNGQALSVSQFTLYANTKKGNRPGFDRSADPATARTCWEKFNGLLRHEGIDVREGEFGSHMEVALVNDGPVTVWMDTDQLLAGRSQ